MQPQVAAAKIFPIFLLLAIWTAGIFPSNTAQAQERIFWLEEDDTFAPGGVLLRRANGDGSGVQDLVDVRATGPAEHITLNLEEDRLYWTSPGRIGRVNADGTGAEHLVGTDGLGGSAVLGEIAVDPTAGKMYWANALGNSIQRANLDGSDVEDVVTDVVDPIAVAVDDAEGKVYWGGSTAAGGFLQRANVDGSDVEELVTDGVWLPQSIALDVSEGKMYWSDLVGNDIRRANLDGSDAEDLVSDVDNPDALALDLDAGVMYWADRGIGSQGPTVQRANLDGSDLQVVASGDADGMILDVENGLFYRSVGGTIRRADLDNIEEEENVTIFASRLNEIHLDEAGGMIYWEDDETDNILRTDVDGSRIEHVVGGVMGWWSWPNLALSSAQGKVYWAGNDGVIGRADLDGSNVEELVTGQDRPRYPVLDETNGRIYWLTGDNLTPHELFRANLDGSNVEEFPGLAGDWPEDLTLDASRGKLYWIHEDGLRRADLDGSNSEDVEFAGFAHQFALDVDGGQIYWITSSGISRANLDGSDLEELVDPDRQRLLRLDTENGSMYWTTTNSNGDQSNLYRANLDGSQQEELVTDANVISDLIVSSSTPTFADDAPSVPDTYSLLPAYPNPFNPSTTISFDLERAGNVAIAVYDVLGRRLQMTQQNYLQAGRHEQRIDMTGFAGGAYFYEMRVLDEQGAQVFRGTRSFLLAK